MKIPSILTAVVVAGIVLGGFVLMRYPQDQASPPVDAGIIASANVVSPMRAAAGATVSPRRDAPVLDAPHERDIVGRTPAVRGDLNANVRSVVEAARTGTHPERLSYLVPATPWDAAAFAKDPQAFIDVVEPGRCFQTAPEGADMPPLQIVGDAAVTVAQGEPTVLRVQSQPHAPATFTSTGCGRFQNSLTSITVLADDQGIASATFVAPPGTLNGVTIIVGSPMATGHLMYAISVTPALASASTR